MGTDIPSTLDLVISNNDSIDNIFNLSPLGKSDHSVLQVECNMTFKVDKKCKLNFNKGDYSALINFIQLKFQTEEANTILGSNICVEDQWQYVKESLNAGIEKYIPITDYALKNTQVWKQSLPTTTRKLIRKKHRLWSRYQKRNNREVKKKYNKVRNLVRKETRARTATVQGNIAKSV